MSDIADPLQQMKAAVAANDQDALEHGYSAWLAIPGSRPPTAESPAGCDHPLQIVMDEAARHGNTPAVRFLRHRHFTVRSSTVWLAAGRRALDVLDVLLAPGGWSIDAPLDQHTPSLLALAYKSHSTVEWLLARGADPMARSEMGRTALDLLAQFAQPESVRLAVANGGRPAECYALHAAVKCRARRRSEVVGILLERGARVNVLEFQDDELNYERWKGSPLGTPLHYAARFAEADVVELLLKHGADSTMRDSVGRLPMDWAERGKKSANIALFMTGKETK